MSTCPVCESQAELVQVPNEDPSRVECGRCGTYVVSSEFLYRCDGQWPTQWPQRHLVAGALRSAHERGQPWRLMTDSFEELLRTYPPPRDLPEQMDRLLLHLQNYLRKRRAGTVDPPPLSTPHNEAIVYASTPDELSDIIDALKAEGLLQDQRRDPASMITVKGGLYLRKLTRERRDTTKAFVAMWFDDQTTDAFRKGIEPALTGCGFRPPFRVDSVEHNDKICDRIAAEIRASSLVVADFTGHRGGVYFEAGYALGLGIPVIWTCRNNGEADSDGLNGAHFDTRQYNHITWSSGREDELRQRIEDRIRATVPLSDLPHRSAR